MVSNLKDLEKLLKLLRKQGVTRFAQGDLSIDLGDAPNPPAGNQSVQAAADLDPSNPWANFPEGELSPEALAFYSAGGRPGEEPEGLLDDENQQAKA